MNQAECNFNTDQNMRSLYRENYSCTFPDFDSKQIDLLIPLLKEILSNHEEIKPTYIKYLREFRKNNLPSISEIRCAFNHYGYKIDSTSSEKDSFYVIRAFQYHFRPSNNNGSLDTETIAILWALLEKYFPNVLDRNLKVICPID